MKLTLKRTEAPFHFSIQNSEGQVIHTDASPDIGGTSKGMRPMELFLAALSSCSSIDIVHLLQKARQELQDIKVEVSGRRRKDEVPAIFTDIDIHFKLYGPIKDEKAKWAVESSIEKYCSVSKMIDQVVNIYPTYEIINNGVSSTD